MDLPVIGGHCEAHRCGDLDLLPIRCCGCQKLFCRQHVALDSHSCVSLAANNISDVSESQVWDVVPRRCAFAGCQKPTLESVVVDTTELDHRLVAICAHCSRAFCVTHRHSSDHACINLPSALTLTQKNSEAHRLLAKHFPATVLSKDTAATSKPTKRPADSKKLARLRVVELMKMRHQAIPGDPKDTKSTPLSQRLHINVVPNTNFPSSEKIFWLRKTIGTGRALDLLATHFSICISDTTPAYLDKIIPENEASVRLRNDKLLSEQVEDGDTLFLVGTRE
ncbi:hypothetical protein K439DRAFT_1393901 [Ramaria rubella]|nr:hypothetical protein K439DRAFT_1393901 [Ramaria rubella]